jgi:CHAT domain
MDSTAPSIDADFDVFLVRFLASRGQLRLLPFFGSSPEGAFGVGTERGRVKSFADIDQAVPRGGRFNRRWIAWAVPILGAAALSFWAIGQSSRDPLARLIRAAQGVRPGIVRFSGFPYGSETVASRGEQGPAPNLPLLAEVARVQRVAATRADSRTLHTLGIAQALLGHLEQAVETLRLACEGPDCGVIGADLAAALISRGWHSESPRTVAEGLEILSQGRMPLSLESRFNEALALEALALRNQAITTWRRYLLDDPRSGWAAEARVHLGRLLEGAGQSPEIDAASLEHRVVDELLPEWGGAVLSGAEDAAKSALAGARQVAASYEQRFDDPLLSSLVASVGLASLEGQHALAEAHLALAGARAAYGSQDLEKCRRQATAARRSLGGPGTHLLASLLALANASCAYLASDLSESEQQLQAASGLAHSERPSSPLLQARVDWLQGLIAHASGRPLSSLQHYHRSLLTFERLGDSPRAARMRGLMADLDEYLGQTDAAWHDAVLALRGLLDTGQRYQALSALVRLAGDGHLPGVAARLAASAQDEARQTNLPEYLADSEMVLAGALAANGGRAAAVSALRRAIVVARGIHEEARSRHMLGFARVALAEMLVNDDPAAAAQLLDDASLVGGGDLAITAARVRAESARRRGLEAEAEAGLRDAIERSRSERIVFADLRDRDLFFVRRESLHMALMHLLASEGRNEEALEVLEEWRTESVEGGRGAGGRARPKGDLLQRLLQYPGHAFYSVVSLPEELWVWRVTAAGVALTRRTLERSQFQALVDRASSELRMGGSREAAKSLAELILGDSVPPGVSDLIVAPDSVSSSIPFSALPSPGSGSPLVTAYRIAVSPSLLVWAHREDSPSRGSSCALVVEGAVDGGDVAPGLPRLIRLADEIRVVGSGYRCVLHARKPAELEEQLNKRPAVVHYAGHAIAMGPGGAFLLLGGEEVVAVEAPEIEGWPLEGATVVLSACSGASGRASALAGRDGLARAFLSAGARSVVANLWPVGDDVAFELATELHARLSQGESVGSALGSAQRELIARGRRPSAWGGWVLVGAG